MVLNKQRKRIDPILEKLSKPCININPDLLTYLSVLFAFIAGLFFFLSHPNQELINYYLIFAALFIFLNGLFDALDGKIAKMTKKASPRGDFLDHALDRYADVFIVGGLALSTWCRPSIGILALIGMLLTSYISTQAQATGQKRNYGGLLGRADRLVLLIIFPIIQHITLRTSFQPPFNTTILEILMIFFAIVGNFTALQRFYITMKRFSKK